MKEAIYAPIIVIGMHRSGTSMVARMLEELGLFVGKRKMADHEPYFFLGLNDWMLRQCGGAWDQPEPIRYLLENDEVRALAGDYIRSLMETPRVISFLGWRNYRRFRTPWNLDFPWGWKDPRNTYTLPLWLDLFPNARVIHIYRHGVDVASSLKLRTDRAITRAKVSHERRRKLRLYGLRLKRGGFTGSLRCTSLEGGFGLWESYLTEARKHVANLGERAVELKYEHFLSEPSESLTRLARFCELPVTRARTIEVAGYVKKERSYAYLKDPELRMFAKEKSEQLKVWGY